MKKFRPYFAGVCLTLFLLLVSSSCSSDKFKIKGEIEGADNELVILNKADFAGRWMFLDSVRTDRSGRFSFSRPAPDSPEIYAISTPLGVAYVPIDSTETVTFFADSKNFPGTWRVEGSAMADALSSFESDVRKFMPHSAVPDSAKAFKRRVYSKYIQNEQGSLVSYYILTRTLNDDRPLFDPADSADLGIFAAVATAFKEYHPNDPRTPLLENTVLDARRAKNSAAGRKRVVEAEEAGLIPIVLPDENGRNVSLSSVVGHGKPTLLMFGVMSLPETPNYNRIISDIINRRGGDLTVYSVSFDADAGFWREAARNVPWITVLDHNATTSVATDYNIPSLPCFYIIDRSGNLVDRTNDIVEVEKLIRKHS